jgi:hypothetical protein
MSDVEWAMVSSMLGEWWPGEWSASKAEAYRMAVGNLPAEKVTEALQRRLQAGERFRPSAAELYASTVGTAQMTVRSPEEAWSLIEAAIAKVGCSVYAKEFDARHQAAIDWLAEQDAVVAAFAARRGLCGKGSLGHEPVGDPTYGGAVTNRIGKDYKEFVGRVQERVALGRPGVTPEMLEVRSRGERGGGMKELLDRLRPEQDQIGPGDTGDEDE